MKDLVKEIVNNLRKYDLIYMIAKSFVFSEIYYLIFSSLYSIKLLMGINLMFSFYLCRLKLNMNCKIEKVKYLVKIIGFMIGVVDFLVMISNYNDLTLYLFGMLIFECYRALYNSIVRFNYY